MLISKLDISLHMFTSFVTFTAAEKGSTNSRFCFWQNIPRLHRTLNHSVFIAIQDTLLYELHSL